MKQDPARTDESAPILPSPDDVDRAARRIRVHLGPTPLEPSRAFSQLAGCQVYLKLESAQPIRTFKVRGAINKVAGLPPRRRREGVITASAGNHGLGVAYAAAAFEAPATVYVPEAANGLKVAAIERLGAHVIRAGRDYNAAYLAAVEAQQHGDQTFVHAYDDPAVIAGQGTIARELIRQLPAFDTVVVPVGGGGLIGGIAMYLKACRPNVRVVGVEPLGADAMGRSLIAGRPVFLDQVNTIADGLAASAPGRLTLPLAQLYVNSVIAVDDDDLLRAIRMLFEWEHVVAEPAGAAGIAALLWHYRPEARERVVVVISGSNISRELMVKALGTT